MSGKHDRPSGEDKMPTVSGPSLDHKTILHAPAPQIKGYRIIGELGVAGQGRVWPCAAL